MAIHATKESWKQRIQEAEVRAEEELRRVIQYMNDEVIPDVRRNGSAALRAAAAKLQRLAESMDAGPRQPPPSNPKEDARR